jgi:hypothetical protein
VSSTVDVALLRKTLEYVTAHPERWEQGYWIRSTPCGTTACLAGTVVLHAGYRPHRDFAAESRMLSYVHVGPDVPVPRVRADVAEVREVAKLLLGLDEDEATRLFYSRNTLRDLWRLASHLTGGEIEVPAEPLPDDVTVVVT